MSDSHSTIPPGSKTGKTYQELEDEVLRLRTCAIEYESMFDDFFSKTPDAFRQYARIKSARGVIGHEKFIIDRSLQAYQTACVL